MENIKPQTNTSNLESAKSAALLSHDELKNFRKLSKEEQKKQKEDRLKKLEELQNNFRKAVEEATKTGSVEEAKRLKVAFDEKAEELKQLIAETEIFNVKVMEIIPDKEITSAETAIEKLEAQGHQVRDYAKDMLTKVDWKEKLKDSYEIVSISVNELFGDNNSHTYAEIKAKAKENGLKLVPAKLAPSIRLNYDKSGQWTNIAMEVISNHIGIPMIFLCNKEDLASYLNVCTAGGSGGWNSSSRFFFVRKQKPQSKSSWIHKFLKL